MSISFLLLTNSTAAVHKPTHAPSCALSWPHPTPKSISHTVAGVILLKHTSDHLSPLLKMCFPPQHLQHAIKVPPHIMGPSYHDLLVVSTKLSQSSLPHSCCSLYLGSILYLANSYTSFRPRPSTICHLPCQVSPGPQFGLSAHPPPTPLPCSQSI